MAKKFVLNTLILGLAGIFCMVATYDAMPTISCGFAVITAIISIISYSVDRKCGVGLWE